MDRWTLLRGDCLDVLKKIESNSIDACVTDPPYGLSDDVDIRKVIRHWFVGKDYKHDGPGYMGADWDSFVPGPEIWREVFRVLKPGAHLLAFTGSRTMDLMGFSIRFAGFEARETIMAWVYGVAKAKGLDVSKGIDSFYGAERKVLERKTIKSRGYHIFTLDDETGIEVTVTEPATPEAVYWNGWYTGMKPAFEPVLVFRKPLEGTAVENVLKHRTGAINVDATRPDPPVGAEPGTKGFFTPNVVYSHHPMCEEGGKCHTECAVPVLNRQYEDGIRFFPQFYFNGKASKDDRFAYVECGCPEPLVVPLVEAEELVHPQGDKANVASCQKCQKPYWYERHPTVKPTNVMRWLVRLVVPKGGLVLDPFNGSGSTGVAALHERCRYVGIEREQKYWAIASARLKHTEELAPTYAEPEPLRGIDVAGEVEKPEVIPLPDSEALRKAFDLTEETVAVERKPGSLAPKDFKRLVAKSLKR